MKRVLKLLLVCTMLALIPMRGLAAVTVGICAAGNQRSQGSQSFFAWLRALRAWVVGLAFLAVAGIVLQPVCDASTLPQHTLAAVSGAVEDASCCAAFAVSHEAAPDVTAALPTTPAALPPLASPPVLAFIPSAPDRIRPARPLGRVLKYAARSARLLI